MCVCHVPAVRQIMIHHVDGALMSAVKIINKPSLPFSHTHTHTPFFLLLLSFFFPQSFLSLTKSELELATYNLASCRGLTHTCHVKRRSYCIKHTHVHSLTPKLMHSINTRAQSLKSLATLPLCPFMLLRPHFSLTTHCDCLRCDPWELITTSSIVIPHN